MCGPGRGVGRGEGMDPGGAAPAHVTSACEALSLRNAPIEEAERPGICITIQ